MQMEELDIASPISVRYEGDKQRAQELLPAAMNLLAKCKQVKASTMVDALWMHRTLDGGEYLRVGSIHTVDIVEMYGLPLPEVQQQEWPYPVEPVEFNMWHGTVWNGLLSEQTIPKLAKDGQSIDYDNKEPALELWSPTAEYMRVKNEQLKNMDEATRAASSPEERLKRQLQRELATVKNEPQPRKELGVKPDPTGFPEFMPPPKSQLTFTQYQKPLPTMWSGKMKQVVQWVMAYGRHDPRLFAKSYADLKKPNAYMRRVQANGVQILYDYKFTRSHILTYDSRGNPWLVEISSQGVRAVPFPQIWIPPEGDRKKDKDWLPSTSAEFRKRFAKDRHVTHILDELGFVPSGEPFPDAASFRRMVDAGEAIELVTADRMSGFYTLGAFGPYTGWSTTTTGMSAVNCGYKYEDDEPYQFSECWQISLSISKGKEGELDRASGSGSIYRMYRGKLRQLSRRQGLLFLYYEPGMQGIINHPCKPQRTAKGTPKAIYDGPFWAGYVNDDLKVIRWYFSDYNEPYVTRHDDRDDEPCPKGPGSWSYESTSGTRGVPGGVYSNDFDNRQWGAEHSISGTITRKPGPSLGISCGHNPVNPAQGFCSESFAMITNSTETRTGGEGYSACAAHPYGVRDGYCMWLAHSFATGKSIHRVWGFDTVGGNWGAETFRNWLNTYPKDSNPDPSDTPGGCGGKHYENKVVNVWDIDQGECTSPFQGHKPSQCQDMDPYFRGDNRAGANLPTGSNRVDLGHDFEGTVHVVLDGVDDMPERQITENEWAYATSASPSETGNVLYLGWGGGVLNAQLSYSLGYGESRTIRDDQTPKPPSNKRNTFTPIGSHI